MHASSENTAAPSDSSHRLGPRGVAALTLFAANAGMLFLYFALDLTLFQLVVVYWFEALWIGFFSGLKLLTASLFGDPYENRWVDVSPGSGFLISLFAIVKSGGAFLFILVITGVALVVAQDEEEAHQDGHGLDDGIVLLVEGLEHLRAQPGDAEVDLHQQRAGDELMFVVEFVVDHEWQLFVALHAMFDGFVRVQVACLRQPA